MPASTNSTTSSTQLNPHADRIGYIQLLHAHVHYTHHRTFLVSDTSYSYTKIFVLLGDQTKENYEKSRGTEV